MNSAWHINILTLFPEIFPGVLDFSVTGRARKNNLWSYAAHDIRSFASDKHRTVDDTAFGGGPGMVMRPDVVDAALQGVLKTDSSCAKDHKIIYLSPRGRTFNQKVAHELVSHPQITLLCGRFEGVDDRVVRAWDMDEISLGDFVLSGGEIAAMALIDACLRLIPGVLGDETSINDESFSENLLEYPQYTRPQVWNGIAVPDVLMSGHHEKIRAWRHAQAQDITRQRRPDLWQQYTNNQCKI